MECQPQNPEFGINPENIHPWIQAFSLKECVTKNLISYFSTKTYVVCSQKNQLNETVL